MPINQSPMYLNAEKQYRAASTTAEKLAALEEMLRLVPKHKGSEKLQSQIKQKIKVARKELQQPRSKAGGGHRDLFVVPKQGAGQVALLGAANVGKSSIVQALSEAKVEIAEFPFSTQVAVPGMAYHEDVPIQLVDMPPIVDGHAQPGMVGAYRSADIVLLVVDLSAIELLDQFEEPLALLSGRGMRAASQIDRQYDSETADAVPKCVLVAANKCDSPGAVDNFRGFEELCGGDLLMMPVSARTGEGLEAMMGKLFELLNVNRIYAKKPGKPVDAKDPFIIVKGATVQDLAYKVHRELAEKLKTARVWGTGVYDGQQVHHSHVLEDKDVVELHF